MTTNLIMAICLIVPAAVAVWMIVRYWRKTTECELKLKELAEKEAALEGWRDKLQKQTKELGKERTEWHETRKHVYANYEVLDSVENKPSAKTIGKSLSSKIGYALRHEFPDIAERHDFVKGGRTVYSVDFYVTKYE